MQRAGGGGVYQVLERESFGADWRRGIGEGWINSMADQVTLQAIKEHLAQFPKATEPIDGLPENVRIIGFPRSARRTTGRLEIEYEIIEDDGIVWLVSINPVG